ncbi:hypothetical protein CFP65_2156 [Kitasatospora sp. MMS16-BH015]|uniref:hypothetical protein n=1 Tax=Kitasatospora sp. MMS16-BH015 TaxID=2018025 RepID=UPI000CA2E085|nr:hypothetical protein [Kitasatospora sp. MMS16-BH015]AUG77008.1 hypothetical protein CFP65_2156 [Kitasatospora sp. MMS16-BH015]
MHRPSRRPTVAAAVALAGAALLLTGCSSGSSGNAGSAVSSAAAAAQSAASAAASAANGLASSAASAAAGAQSAVASLAGGAESAAASAQSAAASALAGVKDGVDAKADVTLGPVVTGSDGRSDAPVTVTNHATKGYRYSIEVTFKDSSGSVVDAVVVTVPEVAPAAVAQASARSNRTLDGTVTATLGAAVRY